MERPHAMPRGDRLIRRPRRAQRLVRVDRDEGVQLPLMLLDAREASLCQLPGREPTGVQVRRYDFFFDDGTKQESSGPQTTRSFNRRGNNTIRVDVIGLNNEVIATQTLVINVS